MSHYAYVNPYTNQVEKVLVIDSKQIKTGKFGNPKNFKKCSYTKKIGKLFPGVGYYYVEPSSIFDIKSNYYFIPPRPFLSWQFDEESWCWKPPKPYPNDNLKYFWNEEMREWVHKMETIIILPKPDKSYILNERYQWESRTSFYIRKFKENKIIKFITKFLF